MAHRSILENNQPELNLKRLQAGDPEMLTLFVETYAPRIYSLAYRMCQNPEMARDTAQEALTLAIEKIHQFRGDSKLITWLYRILFNECLRSKRRERRFMPLVVDYFQAPIWEKGPVSTEMPVQERAAEDRVIDEEQRKVFWLAMMKLPPDQRKVILLRDIEGLSTRETAEVLGITETNVKVRLHRARQRLKTIMESIESIYRREF